MLNLLDQLRLYNDSINLAYVQTYRAFRGSSLGTPWVVLKRTEFCVWKGGGISGSFSMDSPGQLNVVGHGGDMPGMDGTEVGILK